MFEIFLIHIKMNLKFHRKYGSVKVTGYTDRTSVHIHDLLGNGKT